PRAAGIANALVLAAAHAAARAAAALPEARVDVLPQLLANVSVQAGQALEGLRALPEQPLDVRVVLELLLEARPLRHRDRFRWIFGRWRAALRPLVAATALLPARLHDVSRAAAHTTL